MFYSICVLIFGVFTVHHFISKFKRRGILTKAFHFCTSDKTSIFLWLALSFPLFFLHFFWGKRLCENKTLHIYWTEPPLERVTNDLGKRSRSKILVMLSSIKFMELCSIWICVAIDDDLKGKNTFLQTSQDWQFPACSLYLLRSPYRLKKRSVILGWSFKRCLFWKL